MLTPIRRYLNYIYSDMVEKRRAVRFEQVKTQNAHVFLDLGCYNGLTTSRFRKILSPKQAIGLEYDPKSILQAKERQISVARHDLNQPLPMKSNFVDVVTAFDVLEHLVETWQTVAEIFRILKPGGMVLIDCPNLAAWHNIFALAIGIQPPSGPHLISIVDSDMKIVEEMHRQDHNLSQSIVQPERFSASKMHRHIVVPTYWSLRRVLIKVGFDIENSWGFGYYPFPPMISDLLCKIDIGHAHHYIIKARKPDRYETHHPNSLP